MLRRDYVRFIANSFAVVALLCGIALSQVTAPGQTTSGRLGPVDSRTQTQSVPGAVREPSGAAATQPMSGPAVGPQGAAPATAATPAQSTELLIGPGDLLEVSVFGAPEYLKQVRVSAEGLITLPLAGTVQVGHLTTTQAEHLIEEKLSKGGYFNEPRVSVLAKEFATQGVSVLGEVQKPGIYPLPGARSLFDAISAAGGATARAGNTVTVTHRSNPNKPEIVSISYDGSDAGRSNVQVYPGDTVVVSKAGVVYVVGDVRLPGGFVMENSQMTVLQALAMAQGANSTASLNKARLIRKTAADGEPQEISIPLKDVLSAKAPDVALKAEDILFVPASAAKSAGRRTVEAVVQAATGLAIYRR